MKFLSTILLSVVLSASSFASISMPHFMNKIAGSYSYDASGGTYGGTVAFTITNKGQITIAKDPNESFFDVAKLVTVGLKSETGPDGLPIATVILQGGSDEQTATIQLRLSMIQDGDFTELQLLDVIETENDGPNTGAYLYKVKPGKLLKKDKAGKMIQVKKL